MKWSLFFPGALVFLAGAILFGGSVGCRSKTQEAVKEDIHTGAEGVETGARKAGEGVETGIKKAGEGLGKAGEGIGNGLERAGKGLQRAGDKLTSRSHPDGGAADAAADAAP